MRHIILALAVVMSAFQLQAQPALTPIQFNDRLTEITDSLYARGQGWGTQFNEARKSDNYASLRPYRESMERFINANIARVSKMEDVKNSKPLRMAMISFLRFELRMANEAFKPLESLTASSSPEEVQKKIDHLKEIAQGENAELTKVGAAQEAYAKENGFRIESEQEAKDRG